MKAGRNGARLSAKDLRCTMRRGLSCELPNASVILLGPQIEPYENGGPVDELYPAPENTLTVIDWRITGMIRT